jgi:hypothetical protein
MSFGNFLSQHRHGETFEELTAGLRDVVAAVSNEGKPGKMVLTITVKPLGKGDGLQVACKVDVKPPEKTPGESLFFATPSNDLTRQDPRQQAMDLREVVPAEAHRGVA